MGCRYLEWFDGFERTSVETPANGCSLNGVRVVNADFLTWEPDRQYNLVLCLQVLEYIPDPTAFAWKLLECGRVVIVSVPYLWEAGACGEHIHRPVDEKNCGSGWGGTLSRAPWSIAGWLLVADEGARLSCGQRFGYYCCLMSPEF